MIQKFTEKDPDLPQRNKTMATATSSTDCQWQLPLSVLKRGTLSDWKQALHAMHEKNTWYRFGDDITNFIARNIWLPLYDDDHVAILRQALPDNPNIVELYVWLPGNISETAIHSLAACVSRHNIQTVHIDGRIETSIIPFVVSILYLEGNRPFINPIYPGLKFLFECLRLQYNDENLNLFFTLNVDDWSTDLVTFGYSLHGNRMLQSLHISARNLGSSHGEDASDVIALASGIRFSQITQITFDYCIETEFIQTILNYGVRPSGRLFNLTMPGIHVASKLSIDVLPALRALRIVSSTAAFDPRELNNLCHKLSLASNLTRLRFDNSELGDVVNVKTLMDLVCSNSSIKELDLSHNHISDDGIEAFVTNWQPSCQLESLGLHSNVFGPNGVRRLLDYVVTHPALKELKLDSCRMIEQAGLQMIADQLPTLTSLRMLDISNCVGVESSADLDTKEAKQMYEANKTKIWKSMLHGIKDNYSICELDAIGNAGFTGKVAWEIDFYTSLNASGRRLIVDANKVPLTLWCHMFDKSAKDELLNRCLIYNCLVELPILVGTFA